MLSDEEKEALRNFKSEYETCDHYSSDLIIELDDAEIILNLIEKQSKEIEEYKKQLDLDYVDMHFVPIERYNQLEKEIEELKEKNSTLKNLQNDTNRLYIEMIERKNYFERELQKLEDKIKAKIEPVLKQLERKMEEEFNKYGNSREYQDVVDAYNFLQSLLEKE